MLNKAIKKINEEIEKVSNPYVKVVGEFLLKQLKAIPEAAEKILAKDKSILKSLDEMQKAAQKKRVGNCAVLTDQEGFEIVLKYYGIESKSVEVVTSDRKIITVPAENIIKEVNKKADEIEFDVSLDDLLI